MCLPSTAVRCETPGSGTARVEVDTQGDAFFVAFARASDAVAAAAEAQVALARGPVQVRMGLHTGEPLRADEGYVGFDVHRAARIAAAEPGGQVLLSQTTADLADADVRDLGPHELKDTEARAGAPLSAWNRRLSAAEDMLKRTSRCPRRRFSDASARSSWRCCCDGPGSGSSR